MPEDNSEDEEEYCVKYTNSENYRKIYANGVYGGLTPRGGLSVDFVIDDMEYPREEVYKPKEGRVSEPITQDVIRERQATLFLDLENALSIASWLMGKVIYGISGERVEEEEIKSLIEDEFDLKPKEE